MVDILLKRYLWLIDTLRYRGQMTLAEIINAWECTSANDARTALNERTFRNHCKAILTNFGIEIACRRGRNLNYYYIANPEELQGNSLNSWLLENFSLSALLSEHSALADKILVEEIPSGRMHLATVLTALREGRVLRVSYRNFAGRGFDARELEPLCVKLFKRRWYLVVRIVESQELRILSLDRVTAMELSEKAYSYPADFSPSEFFAPYYGIIALEGADPVEIRLRAYCELPGYLTSLPLHHSQEVIAQCGEYTDFRLRLVPTFEFVQELLLHRDQLEVLAPASLRGEVAELLCKMQQRYHDA